MSDLKHYIGDDLTVSSTGDLLLADGASAGEQRVLRRLITNPAEQDAAGNTVATGDYLWQQLYGAGLPKEIGRTVDVRRIASIIRSQIFNEAAVARSPDPVITVTPITGGVSVSIQYVDSTSGNPVSLNFNINQ